MKGQKMGKTTHPVTKQTAGGPAIGGGPGNFGGASQKIIGNVGTGSLGGGSGTSGGASKKIIDKVGK